MALRLPIKVKSGAALAVPLLILLAVAVFEIGESERHVRDVREQTELATAAIGPGGLITALQNERNFSALWLVGSESLVDLPVASFDEARQATDESLAAFEDEVARKGGGVERIYAPAIETLEALDEHRADVDAYEGPRNVALYNATAEQSFADYSELVTALVDPTTELTYEVEDGEMRRGVQLIDLAAREIDRIAKFVRMSILVSTQGDGLINQRDEIRRAARMYQVADNAHLRIIELSTGPFAALGEELRVESEETRVRQIGAAIVETGEVDVMGLLEAISLTDDESYYGFVNDVSDVLRARADELNAAAAARQRVVLALAGLLLLVSFVATPLVARSITRPLRSLTRQAKDMAHARLPEAVGGVHETPLGQDIVVPQLEPVRVPVRDEVADVAGMLNRVQTTALDLALEQAVLRRNVADAFVNLARRNQNLLGRQIDFITSLERNETRPDALDDLFRLDHQATRMRRNAESLLVLAGVGQRRHATAPARLTDVVRGALGEVEGYERVSLSRIEPVLVVGPAVADVAHLLAELIENAVRFSPPDRMVDVRGRRRPDGYELSILDRGLGMPKHEIDRANLRLAHAEAFTIAPSQYLGHYVAALLAARHGISVRLEGSVTSGITAIVLLPPDMLVDPGPVKPQWLAPGAAPIPGPAPRPGPDPAPALSPRRPAAAPQPAMAPEPAPGPQAPVPVPAAGGTGSTGPEVRPADVPGADDPTAGLAGAGAPEDEARTATVRRAATPPTEAWAGEVYRMLNRYRAGIQQGAQDRDQLPGRRS